MRSVIKANQGTYLQFKIIYILHVNLCILDLSSLKFLKYTRVLFISWGLTLSYHVFLLLKLNFLASNLTLHLDKE